MKPACTSITRNFTNRSQTVWIRKLPGEQTERSTAGNIEQNTKRYRFVYGYEYRYRYRYFKGGSCLWDCGNLKSVRLGWQSRSTERDFLS